MKPGGASSKSGSPVWWRVINGTMKNLSTNRVSFNAAAAAFYLLLAVIPGLAGIVIIYGFIADPDHVEAVIDMAENAVPKEVILVLEKEIERLANARISGWAVVLGIGLALWCGSNATGALVTGLNVAHSSRERRPWYRKILVSLILALSGLLFCVAVVALLAVVPIILGFAGIADYTSSLIATLRWPALVLVMMLWLSILYRWAPDDKRAKWRLVSWGSFVSSLLWVGGSALFTIYVSVFGRYSAVYGSLGAVVVTMFWLYFSAFVALLGEELNMEIARVRKS